MITSHWPHLEGSRFSELNSVSVFSICAAGVSTVSPFLKDMFKLFKPKHL